LLQDRFRKKEKRPTGGGGSSLDTTDIACQVPKIDDVLEEVDKAIEKANQIQRQLPGEQCCICGCD
jgi:hypothetical protein